MPSFRRRASVIDTDHVEEPAGEPEAAAQPRDAATALTLAEEAEAEAAEAEATAAAARARARAIRLRREAQEAGSTPDATDATESAEDVSVVQGQPADTTEPDLADVVAEDIVAEDIDAEDTDADESSTSPADETLEAPSKRGRAQVLKIAAMALALVATAALLTLSVLMVLHHRAADSERDLNAEYAAAGRQSVVTLMSLDFNNAQEDVKRIIDNSTGQFRTDFESQAEDFVQVATDSKVVTDVTVTATAVETMSQDSATVLVAATSRVTNTAGANQEPRAWRLSVDLQRGNGQIKMSKVEFVP